MRISIFVMIYLLFLVGCTNEPGDTGNMIESTSPELDKANSRILELEAEIESLTAKDTTIAELEDQLSITMSNLDVANGELTDLLKRVDSDVANAAEVEVLQNLLEEKEEMILSLDQTVNQLKEELQYDTANNDKDVVAGFDNGFIRISSAPDLYEAYQVLRIVGYGESGDLGEYNHQVFDFSEGYKSTVAFEITGELYEFTIQNIEWNTDFNDYEVVEIICHFDVIRDSDVIVHSNLAEGLPHELLTWRDIDGKEFYYLIGDTSLGDSRPTILISEVADLNPWWED